MSRALLIVAHPSPQSFSHAMADAARSALRGWTIAFHDLYAERFDPVQPTGESRVSSDPLVEAHCGELLAADLILVFHPRPGVAYDYPPGAGAEAPLIGLLKARAALVFNTSNTLAAREREVFGDPLQDLWERCVFGACGVATVERRMYGPMATSTSAQRGAWLDEVRELVERYA